MTSDTLQWLIGIGLLVVFLLVMMRGCGGMGCGMGGMRGGCGMGSAGGRGRRSENHPGRGEASGPGGAREGVAGPGPE